MSLAYKISRYNRMRKWGIFLKEIVPDENTKVLDVGFSEKEYSDTDNYLEKYYPYPEKLTALGIDIPHRFKTKVS